MRPWVACGFACVVLAGTSEGLAGPRVLRELIVGVAAPSDLMGSILVEILHCGESRDVEQVARTSKQLSPVVIAHLSLNSLVFISCMLIIFVLIYYMLDITCAQ